MKNYFLVIILMGALLFSCSNLGSLIDKNKSNSYFIAPGGQITYCQGGNWFELGKIPVQADAKSFQVLSSAIAKDKNNVFYRGKAQTQVDLSTFYVDNGIPKDRYFAYRISDGTFIKIDNADSRTFEYISNGTAWARDKGSYYFHFKKIDVDRSSFLLINRFFSKDKDSIYMSTGAGDFKGILANTGGVKAINDQYLKVHGKIYFLSSPPAPKLLITSFDSVYNVTVINPNIIRVNDDIITYGEKFKFRTVDANSFQLFPSNKGHIVNDRYSKDKNNVYYGGELIKDADVGSYTPLSFGFGKDAKNVFYEYKLLEGVDSKSFGEMHNHDSVGFVFGDNLGNRFDYRTGKKIP